MKNSRVLIIVNSLQPGGAENAALRTAIGLKESGYKVSIATFSSNRDFYENPFDITRINLGNPFHKHQHLKYRLFHFKLLGRIEFGLKQLINLRNEISHNRPDVVIAFEAFVGSLIAISLLGTKIPLIVSERVNPDPKVYRPHAIAVKARPWIYRHGAICAVQTSGFREFVESNWGITCHVIPNHIFQDDIAKDEPSQRKRQNTILAVGRLVEQKDFETLIRAWQNVQSKIPNWNLEIYGNGDSSSLNRLISELNLKNISIFPATKEIRNKMQSSNLLVSTSIFEGFPNVVLESLAQGTPVVATESTDAIGVMSESGGVLVSQVGNAACVADNMLQLISDSEAYKIYCNAAIHTSKNYTWDKVGVMWENLIKFASETNGITLRRSWR